MGENDRTPWSRLTRDVILFGIGTVGFVTLFALWVFTGRDPNYSLLISCLGIAGAPIALRRDEGR